MESTDPTDAQPELLSARRERVASGLRATDETIAAARAALVELPPASRLRRFARRLAARPDPAEL